MTAAQGYLKRLLANLKALREKAGLSAEDLEDRLILGPGWISRFERGETIPTLDVLLSILHRVGTDFSALLKGVPGASELMEFERSIFAVQDGNDIVVRFHYANFDALYRLCSATVEQFDTIIKVLRDGLARLDSANEEVREAIKTDAVANCFLTAVKTWPHANPSDLWWFVVYRAYCDPYNHPANYARLDLVQSWKRTGGWALEKILVRHYGPFLARHGVDLYIADDAAKRAIVADLKVGDRLEPDKIDVVLAGNLAGRRRFFGVVHVKASFAERRTDDVPMSRALVRHGYTSPLWTMDCKSVPEARPSNRGELGPAAGNRRSAKRKDIEDEGYFSGCFSYNANTAPSGDKIAADKRIYICDFTNPDDTFARFIIRRWREFQSA